MVAWIAWISSVKDSPDDPSIPSAPARSSQCGQTAARGSCRTPAPHSKWISSASRSSASDDSFRCGLQTGAKRSWNSGSTVSPG